MYKKSLRSLWRYVFQIQQSHSYRQPANLSPAVSAFPSSPFPGAAQQKLFMCLSQISPDHVKYFLDNDKASTPIPADKNCALRELHRVAHVELGPLA